MVKESRKKRLEHSQKAKEDEFYTLYDDISAEVSMYKEHLRGKRILCPCDWDESYNEEIVFKEENFIISTQLFSDNGTIKQVDIKQSKQKIEKDLNLVKCNFVKFLVSHADDYGIKSISVSGFNPATNEGIRFQDIDYRHYDLVITNPPFSQFREFILTLFKNQIEFLVIGPQNAISYKDVFPFIKSNQMWLGYHYHLTGLIRPDGTVLPKNDNLPRSCCWFTNLDVSYRRDRMILTEEYNPDENLKYKEYGGLIPIYVKETLKIPNNYDKEMAVPITFLQKYNPNQFEILALWAGCEPYLENGKRTYARIIIKKIQ